MTIKKVKPVVRSIYGTHFVGSVREHFKICAHSRRRNNDEGALLVEVLVGMLILVIVFTATTISLSGMADQRIQVEQRDRALKIASEYDELSKVFKCGFIVDKIQDSLATPPLTGLNDYSNQVANCDFAAIEINTPRVNPGDQSFPKEERINENNSIQRFQVDIRYWWEWPGSNNRHQERCGTIYTGVKELPLILVRGIQVTWTEKGLQKRIGIVKRDPVPNNSATFASGNRVSLLINNENLGTTIKFSPYGVDSPSIIRRSDSIFAGQPTRCSIFPYVTPDGTTRLVIPSALPAPTINGLDLEAQDYVLVNS